MYIRATNERHCFQHQRPQLLVVFLFYCCYFPALFSSWSTSTPHPFLWAAPGGFLLQFDRSFPCHQFVDFSGQNCVLVFQVRNVLLFAVHWRCRVSQSTWSMTLDQTLPAVSGCCCRNETVLVFWAKVGQKMLHKCSHLPFSLTYAQLSLLLSALWHGG